MATATLTTKGQITIPREVRERLRLKTGDRIDFTVEPDGRVTLQPRRLPFEDLFGILARPGKRPISVREMDRAIETAVREQWERAGRRPR